MPFGSVRVNVERNGLLRMLVQSTADLIIQISVTGGSLVQTDFLP